MALQITTAALAAKIRVSADPTTPPAEPELGIVEGLRSVADELINLYAPDAPDSVKDEAAVRFVGYLYDAPAGGAVHVDAMRHSGAMSLLAWWRDDGADVVDGTGGGGPAARDTKYFAYVDAPADRDTPVAEVVALFDASVYTGMQGQSFTGLRWTVPNHAYKSVYGLLVPTDFTFTQIIAEPDDFPHDVADLWPQQVDVVNNGATFHQFIAVDPLDWQNGGGGQRVYELRTP